MLKKLFYSITVLLCVSCTHQSSTVGLSLEASDGVLTIELDSLTSNVSDWLDYYYDEDLDSAVLFSVDPVQNEIEFYSLKEGKLLDKVTYEREGPDGVGTLIEIGIQGLDSILIFPPFDHSFYQSRLGDFALSKVEYEKPDEYAAIRSMTNYFGSKAYGDGGFIYTKTLFGGNYMLLDNAELSSKPLMYRVNVASGEVEFSHFTFPDDYWLEGKRNFEFSCVSNSNGFAFSFYADHHIYHGKDFNLPLKKTLAKSKFLPDEFDNLPLTADPNDRRRYFATTPHYGNLIFDQFRKVYYRFCFPKVELEKGDDMRILTLFPKEFSIMILDQEFNVIGETLFNHGSEFAINNVFVGLEGLFVSVNHPENDLNKEDKFSFKLLKIKEFD